jgi:hypothetical protein
MARLITVDSGDLNRDFCHELESGNILFFPTCPFIFPQEERDFLLSQKQSGASNRKNIAYKPDTNRVTNFERSSLEQQAQLLQIMRNYSERSVRLFTQILPSYAGKWRLDYASFRPFQEKGRPLRTRARNDLLHVDSFPTRPLHGNRILRFFTNINPQESRHWLTTEPFAELAERFGGKGGVSFPRAVRGCFSSRLLSRVKKGARKIGFPIALRSPYDVFMLNLHNFLKENETFQKTCHKDHWEFPPNSCWAVYTDQVSHAAISGQYALEQTFIIPRSALVHPEKAPISVLEKLAGRCMVNPLFAK